MTIYSVCVGNYDNVSESKKDEKRLKELGSPFYLFSRDKKYTWKVFTTPLKEKADVVKDNLIRRGFEAFIV